MSTTAVLSDSTLIREALTTGEGLVQGRWAVITDAAADGLIMVEGHGQIGKMDVDVSARAAKEGVEITNNSTIQPLVMLKHFGPENPDAAHFIHQ